ncbi:hypothetical protein ACHAWU_000467 [Discostella pseudostelligera]|uniref:Nucleotide exchange factor SIL1 n=1 Tax=Discostella pseudostelligera TaxID=259834 RepID=A0ABD3MEM7_9STRA
MFTMFFLFVIIVVLQCITCSTTTTVSFFFFVESKEIVATHEWQRLGENDTLPAGLHVKLDLSTGEKWAKLPSDDDEDNNDDGDKIDGDAGGSGSGGSSGRKTLVSSAVLDGTGALTILDNNNNEQQHDSTQNEASSNDAAQEEDDDAKYLMMHRVMSKLPPDELERFGGLPALPSPDNNTALAMQQLTDEQRQIFQKRMDELWTQRQMELKQAQETLADFPEMLKERMATMTQYLEDVDGSLRKVLEERQQRANSVQNDDDSAEEKEEETMEVEKEEVVLANDIISALRDLEYLLSDVDNARDFHTMGGWSILVALLDENVHHSIPMSEDDARDEEVLVLVDKVQALAALCIGTAVSNLDEFRSWALEDVSSAIAKLSHRQQLNVEKVDKVSAVSLLLATFEDELSLRSQLMGEGSMAIPNASNTAATSTSIPSWSNARYQSHATYKLRAIYALGALLRGNPPAQQYFALHHGPEVLVRDALGTLSSVRGPSALADDGLTKLDYKFASKVLALGEDVIMDVLLHGEEYIVVVPSTTNHTVQNPSSPSSSAVGEDGELDAVLLTANQLVAAFTTERWCDLSLRMLFPPFDILGRTTAIGIQEKAMRSVGAMAPACSSSRDRSSDMDNNNIKKKNASTWGLEEVKRVRSEWNREGSDDGLDSRYRRELLELADGVMEALLQ